MTPLTESQFPGTPAQVRAKHVPSSDQAAQIVEKAHAAYLEWQNTPMETRADRMNRAAEILEAGKVQYARVIATEMGKPVKQGMAEIEKCAWCCRYYAQHAAEFLREQEVETEASRSFVSFEPLGVVLAIMPWNFPFWQVFRCAVPAILAGNAVVLKHAANVPKCAIEIEKVFEKAGFPPDLFRSILASANTASKLIEHPLIQAVSLTGSTGAGKSVAEKAAPHLKKVVLELGGSDPYVVLDDADVALAAQTCAAARMVNAGQSCIAAKRFIVMRSVLPEFERLFVEHMKQHRMGDPFDENTTVGTLARLELRDQLHEQVQKSVAAGARLLLGGMIPEPNSSFYPPTVLSDVRRGMPVFDEETFGPVAAIVPVDSEEEAIQAANDTIYGLGAAVFSRDVGRAQNAGRRIRCGCLFVNAMVHSDPRLPFGGAKQSGYGRELAEYGIREFTIVKTIYIQ